MARRSQTWSWRARGYDRDNVGLDFKAIRCSWSPLSSQPHQFDSLPRRGNFAPWDKVTRDSVPWSIVPRCPRVLQVLKALSDSWDCEICGTLGSNQTLLEAFATLWDCVEQCSTGTLSLVLRSKVPSSGTTLGCSISCNCWWGWIKKANVWMEQWHPRKHNITSYSTIFQELTTDVI